jgi:hypothetical protein
VIVGPNYEGIFQYDDDLLRKVLTLNGFGIVGLLRVDSKRLVGGWKSSYSSSADL